MRRASKPTGILSPYFKQHLPLPENVGQVSNKKKERLNRLGLRGLREHRAPLSCATGVGLGPHLGEYQSVTECHHGSQSTLKPIKTGREVLQGLLSCRDASSHFQVLLALMLQNILG
jgi:hypothetical protein